MLRRIIKKFIPKTQYGIINEFRNRIYLIYYSIKFKPLIIRKNTSDIEVFKQIFVSREYDFPVNIEPKVIVDAGANAGYSTLYFHNRFPKAKVIAIEPEENNFSILKLNTSRYKQIELVKAGLWYKKTNLKIVDAGLGEWGFKTEEGGDIPTITIDELVNRYNEIDILKMDIEGAEKEFFSHNCDWLNRVNILIIELHDKWREGCSKTFYSAIEKYNFKISQKGENIILFKKL
ncbi:MAG: FkbM family methyltransferase [Patescibacteria group bacterium]|nr:FkbM family methyltransferase [Patescibacteria group bacterium]